MADVKSLAVRGIRSFGPDDSDEQRITFEKPLTLILGQNGCGKTTIIECLRYAITGQMPPGSRNECFVHDPKVNGTTEVLGQVKLKILNAKNKQLEVCRSMRVTALQKKKTKFQTLDSFLSVVEPNGKTTDISSRCKDLDNTIHEELGVSKAIMNSVIFCHQEDSSWPLDEGKKVKERFDEIFDADKYSKCFDHLKKVRKEYTTAIKLLEQKVSFLSEQKEDLDKKKIDVVNTESKLSEAEIKVAESAKELAPVSEKITAIQAIQKNLALYENKKEKVKGKLENLQSQEQDLKTSIKTLFEGPTIELQKKINNYTVNTKVKEKELSDSYKKNSSFNEQEEKIANEKTANEIKFNKLILLESQNQERIDKRNKMIVEVGKLAEVDIADIETDEDTEKGMKMLQEKVNSLKKELDELRSSTDTEEKKLQLVIDESLDALSRHKQKISNKENEIANNKKETTKLQKSINDANQSKVQLEVLEKKHAAAEEDYNKAVEDLNVDEFQKEINDDEKAMEEHEQELDQIDKKITVLQKQSAKQKEKDIIEESLKQKEKQITVLKNKHKTALTELLGEMPEKSFAVSVNKKESEIRKEVDSIKKKLKEKQTEVTKSETERKHVREMLTERREELTKAEDQMYKACGTQSYESTLSKLNTTVEKLQEEQNLLQSSIFIIAKYKGQLQENSCCPLCSRGFETDTEVTDLITQLTTQVMNVPAKLEKVTEELQKSSAKKDELLSMKTLNEKITSLKEVDIPKLETRLSDVDKKIQSANEAVEELSMSLMEPEQKMQVAKQLQGDMPLIDKYAQEILTTTKKLDAITASCVGFETDMSLEDASAKQKDLKLKVGTLRARVRAAHTKLNSHNKKLQKMADSKNKIKEQLLNVQKKVQEIFNLQEKLKELETDKERLEAELKELQEGIAPLEEALKEKKAAKNEVVKKNRSATDAKRSYVTKFTNSYDKVKSIEEEIKQHKERNTPLQMEKIKEANDKLMEKQKQIMVDRDTLTKKIDSLKDELAKSEMYKRDLDDNYKLRKAQTEIANCEKELETINEKLGGINTDSISELESLITKQTQLFREKAQTEGQLKELKDRLKHVKMELKKAQSKDVEKNYREKKFELYATKALDKDIRDFSVALEKSLMEFHRSKMENVNHIIRGMWRKIYRGNDIDHIEIKTEGSFTNESDRRKYDYRVVQYKNGNEIDMRGRCSAGQKVLACLIIRLALAETFSSRFGILALDEPTTNLDQENVRSLCAALGEIVQERMQQKNFMFIIITHDKDFIESLGQVDKVTHYYEVSRNDEGKSRVKKIRFS